MVTKFLRWVGQVAWYRKAVYNGKIDGAHGMPGDADEASPPFLRQEASGQQEVANKTARAWVKSDAAYHNRYSRSCQRAMSALCSNEKAEEDLAKARAHLHDVQARADQLHNSLNPHGFFYITPGWYLVLVIFLAVLDLPVTYYGLQALGLQPIMTGMISLLVVTLLVGLGHVAGEYARQLRWGEGTLLAGVLALAAVFVGSVTYLREIATEAILLEVDGIDPLAGTLVFGCMTLLAFCFPAIMSYHLMRLPMAGVVAQAQSTLRDTERASKRAQRRLGLERQALQREINDRVWLHKQARQKIESLKASLLTFQHRYVTANVRHRPGNRLPQALLPHNLPQLEIPSVLDRGFDWNPPLEEAQALLSDKSKQEAGVL